MSITKRIIDLAKANLNQLLERAADTADPRRKLASIPDAELEAELARRKAARLGEDKVTAARARVDAGGSTGAAPKMPADRAERERVAKEREARVRAACEAREKASRENAERAWKAQRPSGSAGPRPSGAGTGGAAGAKRPFGRGQDPDAKRYYDRLELPYDSDFEAVKAAYRKLMRRYHPDLHGNKSPDKQRAATEVAQALTQAYNELEKRLVGGPNRR